MKNLVDELNKLDDVQYSVSPDFSKNVIKKAKQNNNWTNIITFASIASAACVVCFCVFYLYNTGSQDSAQSVSTYNKSEYESIKDEKLEDYIDFTKGTNTVAVEESAIEDTDYISGEEE